MLKEVASAREDSLRSKEETLSAYRQMLRQAQGTLTVLGKEGVTSIGAPNFAPLFDRPRQ